MGSNLHQENVERFHKTIRFEKTDRVPSISNFFTWKIHDSEYSLKEALYDYKKMEKLTIAFHERYKFDAYMDLGGRNPLAVTDALGGGSSYIFNPETDSINVVDNPVMTADDYDAMIANPVAFKREMFKRKYTNVTAKKLSDSMSKFMSFGQYTAKMTKLFFEKYGSVSIYDMNALMVIPLEDFASTYRGLKNMSIDLRRQPDKVKEAFDVYYRTYNKDVVEKTLNNEKPNELYLADFFLSWVAVEILSAKQFEKFYLPYLRPMFDNLEAKHKTCSIFAENSIMRFTDYLADYNKGCFVLALETDDLIEMRAKLPNVALAGGMTTDKLGHATPEECVSEAKRLIDTLGRGYIMSQNKMVSFKNDCTRENLQAVCDFTRSYSLK